MNTMSNNSSNVLTATMTRRHALRLGIFAAPAVLAMAHPMMSSASVTAAPPIALTNHLRRSVSNRSTLVAGTYQPAETTTGVLPGTPLTVHHGDIQLTTPGTVLENLDVYGFIDVMAADCIIRNCRVRGSGPSTYNRPLIQCQSQACVNAVIEDCELRPDQPSYWLNGITGHDFTARRCNIYWTVDGIGIFDTVKKTADVNVLVEACYIHDLSFFTPDPNHTNDHMTHNDGIQIQGGANGRIIGNNIQGFLQVPAGAWPGFNASLSDPTRLHPQYGAIATSCVQATPNVGVLTGWVVDSNYLNGGAVGVNLANSTPTSDFGTISRNRFGHGQGLPLGHAADSANTWAIATHVNQTATLTGNTYGDTGASIVPKLNHG